MKLSKKLDPVVYFNAALLVENSPMFRGCCAALEDECQYVGEKRNHLKAFAKVFKPEGCFRYKFWWDKPWDGFESYQDRVNALLFMVEIIESGGL